MPESLEEGRRTTAEVLRRSLRRLAIATVLLYVIIGGVALKNYLDQRSTRRALCTLRSDQILQVQASIKYLTDHPNGAPGIPVSAIADGIERQQRTIAALRNLNCNGLNVVAPTPTPKGP